MYSSLLCRVTVGVPRVERALIAGRPLVCVCVCCYVVTVWFPGDEQKHVVLIRVITVSGGRCFGGGTIEWACCHMQSSTCIVAYSHLLLGCDLFSKSFLFIPSF